MSSKTSVVRVTGNKQVCAFLDERGLKHSDVTITYVGDENSIAEIEKGQRSMYDIFFSEDSG